MAGRRGCDVGCARSAVPKIVLEIGAVNGLFVLTLNTKLIRYEHVFWKWGEGNWTSEELFGELNRRFDLLGGEDLSSLPVESMGDDVKQLLRIRNRAEAEAARRLQRFDKGQGFVASGALTARAWMRWQTSSHARISRWSKIAPMRTPANGKAKELERLAQPEPSASNPANS